MILNKQKQLFKPMSFQFFIILFGNVIMDFFQWALYSFHPSTRNGIRDWVNKWMKLMNNDEWGRKNKANRGIGNSVNVKDAVRQGLNVQKDL